LFEWPLTISLLAAQWSFPILLKWLLVASYHSWGKVGKQFTFVYWKDITFLIAGIQIFWRFFQIAAEFPWQCRKFVFRCNYTSAPFGSFFHSWSTFLHWPFKGPRNVIMSGCRRCAVLGGITMNLTLFPTQKYKILWRTWELRLSRTMTLVYHNISVF
jgi:hypothetical protein